MGNRSITYFTDGNYFSPGVYTHFNSGRIFYYLKHAHLRSGDVEYSAARFVAECCKRMEGNLSVGLVESPTKKMQTTLKNLTKQGNLDKIYRESAGDNGIYLVTCEKDGTFTVRQISKFFENRKTRKDFRVLEAPFYEYLDKVECRLIGTLPARPDESGSKPKRMPKKEVKSSTVKSIAVSQKKNLLVTFQSGSVYRYYNVSDYLVRGFLEADSKGKFLNQKIRGQYPYKLVYKPKGKANATI